MSGHFLDLLVMVDNIFNLKINPNLGMIGFHSKSLSLMAELHQPFCVSMLNFKID